MVKEINVEAAMFKDLVLFNFQDTYRNLTVKTLCGLQFVNVAYDTKYVFKIDDNAFPNLKQVFSFVSSLKTNSSNVLFGRVRVNAHVHRSGNVAVSKDEYPQNIYPDYCYGSFYGLTKGAVKALLAANINFPLIPIEDAALGILAQKSGQVKMMHVAQWLFHPAKKKDLERCTQYFAIHPVPTASMVSLWNMCGKVQRPVQKLLTN